MDFLIANSHDGVTDNGCHSKRRNTLAPNVALQIIHAKRRQSIVSPSDGCVTIQNVVPAPLDAAKGLSIA